MYVMCVCVLGTDFQMLNKQITKAKEIIRKEGHMPNFYLQSIVMLDELVKRVRISLT